MDGLAFSDQPRDSSFTPPRRELLSQREFARRLGVVDSAVSKAKKAGRLPAKCWQGRKLIWPDAREAFRQSADTRGGRRDEDERPAASLPASLPVAEEQAEAESLRAIKRQREEVALQIAQLELAEKQDKLRPKAEIERAFTTIMRTYRQELDGIIQWAAPLAALTGGDQQQIASWLKTEVRALQEKTAKSLSALEEQSNDALNA